MVLFMIDGSSDGSDAIDNYEKIKEFEKDENRILLIISKADKSVSKEVNKLLEQEPFSKLKKVFTSTKTEDGLNSLRNELADALGIMPVEGVFIARRRHLTNLEKAYQYIINAKEILQTGDLVLCAQEIRQAQDYLGMITGKVTSDDILGKIFSTFCIGK